MKHPWNKKKHKIGDAVEYHNCETYPEYCGNVAIVERLVVNDGKEMYVLAWVLGHPDLLSGYNHIAIGFELGLLYPLGEDPHGKA